MLNALRPDLTRLLTPVGQALARTPVTPNAITVTGTSASWPARSCCSPPGSCSRAPWSCTFFVLADMLDGVLARIKGTSGAWGAFLDSTLDRVGRRGGVRGPGHLVRPRRPGAARRGGPVLPGGWPAGLVRQGPGRGAGAAL